MGTIGKRKGRGKIPWLGKVINIATITREQLRLNEVVQCHDTD